MNNASVFESDFLTNDSLVPAFVFCRESQSVQMTRLHQTSIGISRKIKALFDKQRAAMGQLQNIFRYPYSGAIKGIGLSADGETSS